MSSNRDHIDIALASIKCFSDDGRLDADELDRLLALAERDGTITEDETRVLEGVMSKVKPDEIDSALQARMAHVRSRIGAARAP